MDQSPTSLPRRALTFATLFVALNAANARTEAINDLETFVNSTKTLRADFTQLSTKPNGQRARPIRGTLELRRPGQFRFHYQAPFEQIIQSDGQTLWIHDLDLNQVTQRKLGLVASFAPALAVASAKDYASVARSFDIAAMPTPKDATGRWLRASPKDPTVGEAGTGNEGISSAGTQIEIGFAGPPGKASLSDLVIVDASGQRTALKFDKLELNPVLAPQHFRFTPPAGANVFKP